VGAVANGYAESAWRPDIAGDNDESFGPWRLKFQFYGKAIRDGYFVNGKLIMAGIGVDIRTEPDLARHVAAVLFGFDMPANAATRAALEAATTGVDATRIWASGFERASAGNAVERRVAIAPQIEAWLAKLP
jgi:hypothetical protein